jgi:hypothetical protein
MHKQRERETEIERGEEKKIVIKKEAHAIEKISKRVSFRFSKTSIWS